MEVYEIQLLRKSTGELIQSFHTNNEAQKEWKMDQIVLIYDLHPTEDITQKVEEWASLDDGGDIVLTLDRVHVSIWDFLTKKRFKW